MQRQLDLDHYARASLRGDVRRPRLSDVRNMQELPAQGRSSSKNIERLRLATINIGTLTGRSRELADVFMKRRVDIACIQETKWKGAKAKDIGEGYKAIYYGSSPSKNGVAVVVSGRFRDKVTQVNRVTDRLMSIKIMSDGITAHIISCYAPQTGCPDDEKDAFWESIDAHIRTLAPEDHILIGGDLNGHVGQEHGGYVQCHGGHGLGVRNAEGNRILDLAEAHDLSVANTFFKKRTTHLATYTSGGHATQIDYWMVRRQNLKLVTNAKVIPYDSVAPQHRLLVLDMRIDHRKHTKTLKNGPERFKWWKVRENKEEIAAELIGFEVNCDQSVEVIWNEATEQIHKAAEKTLGKTKPGRKFIDKQTWWWNEEVQRAVKLKKQAFKAWRESQLAVDLNRYRSLKLAAKAAVAAAKSHHYQDVYDQLGTPEGTNMIYRLAKARHRATQDIGHVKQIKGAYNQVLSDPEAILRRWSDHFASISNQEFPHPPILGPQPNLGPVPFITNMEVRGALEKMKNAKATGPDDIPAEIWKMLGERGTTFLAGLFNRIVAENKPPQAWTTSTTVPIWKGKGDVNECTNYRPIRLLCHAMKVFERILDRRLRDIVKLTPNQCGFVKGSGTTDAIHAARLLMEKHREKNKTVHMAFLDLEKAFDRVPHDLIWRALRSHGVPEEYVRWTQLLYQNVTSRVRCPAGISPPFEITVGVHQGSALSPLLFILCMDTATADLQSPHPWTLIYADDVALADPQRLVLQEQTLEWKNRLEINGMRLNIKKTEYLECGPQTPGSIQIDGQDLEKTTQFKYLGSLVLSDGDTIPDVRSRVSAAWLKWRQLTGILCDKRMPEQLKAKIYKTVVRPVALYGAECWPATKQHEQILHAMEMKMLRWMVGLTRLDHVRNEDVRKRLGVAPIGKKMREARLRWYGHAMRSEENSVSRTAHHFDPGGRRPRGRPKKRWMDTITEDMRAVDLAPEDVHDRSKWRRRSHAADPALGRR